jgi:hypothetical protein
MARVIVCQRCGKRLDGPNFQEGHYTTKLEISGMSTRQMLDADFCAVCIADVISDYSAQPFIDTIEGKDVVKSAK